VAEFKITTQPLPDAPAVNGIVSEKITFCFVDVEFAGFGDKVTGTQKKGKPRTYFECNGDLQGLASGWADSYHQSTPLQELDVTGLAGGVYYLTHLADPDGHWLESNDANNFTWGSSASRGREPIRKWPSSTARRASRR
jgi:Lysyl oxidase